MKNQRDETGWLFQMVAALKTDLTLMHILDRSGTGPLHARGGV